MSGWDTGPVLSVLHLTSSTGQCCCPSDEGQMKQRKRLRLQHVKNLPRGNRCKRRSMDARMPALSHGEVSPDGAFAPFNGVLSHVSHA